MVNIANYNFEGPWVLGTSFNNVPGVYVVYTSQVWLDVGETDSAGQRLNGENHERKSNWTTCSNGMPINIAFLKVDSPALRLSVESGLRATLNPICGER
ncbi:hypothetical protein A2619_04020 [candidate division WWE3 bacterium RIFOXYD1_FULL_39_9]|uniref:GIY-YIG domain-containing protein n=1 Tax=candidate division WWE3 bacterium RIFOXYD1_FULL_39_9 TaxID=1802649 RepID=A0A1F4X9U1_UNCKA|nr:MAG: hypothetical protein A2619_04020 [candidate division WWE3 bacterium RIFOXYD1_FULL_39_9]